MPMIAVIDAKSAAIPKASGRKSLVTIGATTTPSPWANTVPDVSFKASPAKLKEALDKKLPVIRFIGYINNKWLKRNTLYFMGKLGANLLEHVIWITVMVE